MIDINGWYIYIWTGRQAEREREREYIDIKTQLEG